MIRTVKLNCLATCLFMATAIVAHASGKTGATPYAGQQERAIKSLSAEDMDALQEGRGWGFAKPAELNGYPGPLHVLELAEKLSLSAEQQRTIEKVFKEMKAAAKQSGQAFLAAERALNDAFESGVATSPLIAELTLASAKARANVQRVHLEAHLRTTPLLTEAQIHKYKMLRGYAGHGHAGHMKHGNGSHGKH